MGNCPELFYVDLKLPIHVRTDASDYGIGGYIFQIDQQKELPIRFISKALHKAQLTEIVNHPILPLLTRNYTNRNQVARFYPTLPFSPHFTFFTPL